jgi:hypothetical protein
MVSTCPEVMRLLKVWPTGKGTRPIHAETSAKDGATPAQKMERLSFRGGTDMDRVKSKSEADQKQRKTGPREKRERVRAKRATRRLE